MKHSGQIWREVERRRFARRHVRTALDGAIALVAVLLIVQMWLLTATLEAYLAGHGDAPLPGAVASGLLFAAALALYILMLRLDPNP